MYNARTPKFVFVGCLGLEVNHFFQTISPSQGIYSQDSS